MWLITGPFDSEQTGDETSQKTKLLKTNRTYGVGRHNDSALCINNKKVSRQNGEFIVGKHNEDDTSNAGFVPTLSLRNNKSTVIRVTRGEILLAVNPDTMRDLASGDVIRIAGNVNATVTWDPKICFYEPGDGVPTFDVRACAAIGLKVVIKHSRDITHHVTAQITDPTMSPMLLSLLNPAHFVTPQWLQELIRRGNDDAGFEKTYDPVLESAYFPPIESTLGEKHPKMARKVSWDLNGRRQALFVGLRFVFAVIGSGIGSATKATSDIVTRGGAERQLVNVERIAEEQADGVSGIWGAVLKKKKTVLREGMRSGLVLVGDQEAMTERGVPKDTKIAWGVMVEKAKSVDMRIIHPSLIHQAIFRADVSILDCVIEGDTNIDTGGASSDSRPLPDFVPSTHPGEPSQLPPTTATRPVRSSRTDDVAGKPSQPSQTSGGGPPKRLVRRTTSQTPAPESVPPGVPMEVEEEQSAPPKRPLKRRAKTGGLVNELLGLDDTIILDDPSLSREPSQSTPPVPVPPTPARPGRLKRRAGTAAAASQLLPELQLTEEGEEPPLKKFKALFDESGQGNVTNIAETESETFAGGTGITETQLATVMEVEEESQSQTQARKRMADIMEEEGAEGDVGGETQDAEQPLSKKRVIESVNAVERSQKPDSQAATKPNPRATTNIKSTKKNAVSEKPDTDPSFLRAIASNKRGKKNEDDFDREFNQLRIAKPDINDADPNASRVVQWAQEWEGLDDFEKDVGIRGNFMQIVELKIWKDARDTQPGRNRRRESGLGARLDWDGREDFKKFRRKINNASREVVSLVLSQQQDYEREEPHFNYESNTQARGFDDISQSQDQSYSHPIFTQTPSTSKGRSKLQPHPRSKVKPIHEEVDEDDEVQEEVGGRGSKRRGKLASTKGKAPQTDRKPLFDLDSEEEDLSQEPRTFVDETLEDSADLTLRSTKTRTQDERPKTRGTKRKIVLEEESDSDQGLTFGGFSKKIKKR